MENDNNIIGIYDDIQVVMGNKRWKVELSHKSIFSELFNKRTKKPKKKVLDFGKLICSSGNDWDIAYYKDMVAFKNSCERKTYIYPKWYWKSRMRDSFKKLDIIKFD